MERGIEVLGGIIAWIAKGCRTSFAAEIASEKRNRNVFIVIFLILIIFGAFFALNSFSK
jgi:hypothetical protein